MYKYSQVVSYDNQKKTISQWAREYNVYPKLFASRMQTGESIDQIMLWFKSRPRYGPLSNIEIDGAQKTMSQLAYEHNISLSTLLARVNHSGLDIIDALTKPVRDTQPHDVISCLDGSRQIRSCDLLLINGTIKTLKAWAKYYGYTTNGLHNKLRKHRGSLDSLNFIKSKTHTTRPKIIRKHDKITYNGKTWTVTKWADYLRISLGSFARRFRDTQRTFDECMCPLQKPRKRAFSTSAQEPYSDPLPPVAILAKTLIQYNGSVKQLREWAIYLHKSLELLKQRINYLGWDIHSAFTLSTNRHANIIPSTYRDIIPTNCRLFWGDCLTVLGHMHQSSVWAHYLGVSPRVFLKFMNQHRGQRITLKLLNKIKKGTTLTEIELGDVVVETISDKKDRKNYMECINDEFDDLTKPPSGVNPDRIIRVTDDEVFPGIDIPEDIAEFDDLTGVDDELEDLEPRPLSNKELDEFCEIMDEYVGRIKTVHETTDGKQFNNLKDAQKHQDILNYILKNSKDVMAFLEKRKP